MLEPQADDALYLGRIAFATTRRRSSAALAATLRRSIYETMAEAGAPLPRGSVAVEAVEPVPQEGLGGIPADLAWAFTIYIGGPPAALGFWGIAAATAVGALLANAAQRLLESAMGRAFGGDDSSIDLSTVRVTGPPPRTRKKRAHPRKQARRRSHRGHS